MAEVTAAEVIRAAKLIWSMREDLPDFMEQEDIRDALRYAISAAKEGDVEGGVEILNDLCADMDLPHVI